uniref:Carbonic anhydrase-related protein n=1 Tax=Magallana gigas TaxID=29159 RepID=K1PHC1_MAGGI
MALTLSIGPCPTNFRPVLKRQKSVPTKNSRMICMVRTVRVKEWPEGYMYARASEWEENYPAAAGQFQSPINLVSNDAKFDPALLQKPLSINYFTSRETDILNDGHNVIIYPKYRGVETSLRLDPSARSVISGGPLPPGSEYELSDVRFHWGRYSTRGSEHKVNGKAFPMEDYFSWYPTTIPLDFSTHWCYSLRPLLFLSLSLLLLLGRLVSSAARRVLPEKLSARPYIRLGRSTRQRGNQHSGRVHSSLLSYIPLKLPNAQSFTVTLPTPRYTCVPHVQ